MPSAIRTSRPRSTRRKPAPEPGIGLEDLRFVVAGGLECPLREPSRPLSVFTPFWTSLGGQGDTHARQAPSGRQDCGLTLMSEQMPRSADTFVSTIKGEMAGRVARHDWAATPLGAIELWPQSLKTAASIVL